MSKTRALPKLNQPKQPQVHKDPKQQPNHKPTAKVTQRWVPKALLQAQGFYKGKASIWFPKQGQKQVHKPQQQAQQTCQWRPAKPHQKSACTITNLESKTITPQPRTTSQGKPKKIGSVLKKA